MYYVRINTSSNYRDIMVRYAESIEDLDIAPGIIVASSATVFSAPNMLYYEGTYYLTVETNPNGIWQTEAWASNSPISGFNPLPGNPVLGNGAACWFQHIFGTTLHIYYAKQTGTTWTMEYRYADLTEGRIEYQVPGPLISSKMDTFRRSLDYNDFDTTRWNNRDCCTGNHFSSSNPTIDRFLWDRLYR